MRRFDVPLSPGDLLYGRRAFIKIYERNKGAKPMKTKTAVGGGAAAMDADFKAA